jgi:hypothetical protein
LPTTCGKCVTLGGVGIARPVSCFRDTPGGEVGSEKGMEAGAE